MFSAIFLGCPASHFAELPPTNENGLSFQSSCSANCACTMKRFTPICGPDNNTNYFSPCFAGCQPNSLIQSTDGLNQYSMCGCIKGQGMATEAFFPYPLVYGLVADASCKLWESKCGKKGNCWVYDTDKFRIYMHGLTVTLYCMASLFDVFVIFMSKRIRNLYDEDEDREAKDIDKYTVQYGYPGLIWILIIIFSILNSILWKYFSDSSGDGVFDGLRYMVRTLTGQSVKRDRVDSYERQLQITR
ncbi:unnamed protein product, partial [Oppiella nova]